MLGNFYVSTPIEETNTSPLTDEQNNNLISQNSKYHQEDNEREETI